MASAEIHFSLRNYMRRLKTFFRQAAGSVATEAYPQGYVAGRQATENAAGERFQPP